MKCWRNSARAWRFPEHDKGTLELFASHVAAGRATHIEQKFTVSKINVGHETPTTSEGSEATIHGAPTQGIRQRFSIELLGQVIPHVAEFYMLQREHWKIILMTQVAEKHLEDTRPRWKTVFDTLEAD